MLKYKSFIIATVLFWGFDDEHLIFADNLTGNQVVNKGDNVEKVMAVEEVVNQVQELSKKFKITKKEAIQDEGFIFEEKRDNSHRVQLFDKMSKNKKDFLFINDNISSITVSDEEQSGFQLFYYDNGNISFYTEIKKNLPHGVYLKFFKNGMLQQFIEFQNGKVFGREMIWDASGQLVKSVVYKEQKDIKLNIGIPEHKK